MARSFFTISWSPRLMPQKETSKGGRDNEKADEMHKYEIEILKIIF
jgi:hypothetical protein